MFSVISFPGLDYGFLHKGQVYKHKIKGKKEKDKSVTQSHVTSRLHKNPDKRPTKIVKGEKEKKIDYQNFESSNSFIPWTTRFCLM